MNKCFVFDAEHAQRLSESRKKFLDSLLHDILSDVELKTALDVGCGIGFFSNYLLSLGLKVTAFDAREENIAEAKRRYPKINFCVQDVEDSRIQQLGQFDLVLCFGLLYHLENPFHAVRNLYAVTGNVLIIESIILPTKLPMAILVNECQGEDQGMHYVALISSETCIIKMLYRAGFTQVYKTTELPDHEDFKKSFFCHQRRTVLVASKVKVHSSLLKLAEESEPVYYSDIWQMRPGYVVRSIVVFWKSLRSKVRNKVRNMVFRYLPVPVRLPCGVLLTWNDVIGRHFRQRDGFEHREQSFLKQFLKSGMTVLDIGAHYGSYTLLASKQVGLQGYVIAFEPSPRELRRLRLNMLLNWCHNVRIVPSAVGSSEGTAEFFVCLGQETGCNSLRPPAVFEPVKKVRVPITTIDRYLEKAKIRKVDFIKIDVEGAELDVFKGASKLLSDYRPIILCELVDVRTEPWGYFSVEIYDFLKSRGYRWFFITPKGRLQTCPRKERFHENLIAVPEEKLGAIETFLEESWNHA